MSTPSSSALGGVVSRFFLASRICSSRAFSSWFRATRPPTLVVSSSVTLIRITLQEVIQQLVEGGGILNHDPVATLSEDVHLHVGQSFQQVQAGLARDAPVLPAAADAPQAR